MKRILPLIFLSVLFFFADAKSESLISVNPRNLKTLSTKSDTTDLEQISVTAIKQQDLLQSLPVSSTTISGTEAERLDIVSIKGISDIVPNLYIPDYGSRITSSIYMRGLGARMDQSVVGLSVDNVSFLNKDAYDFDVTDIVDVQILRGPQSTLYGRNTMGGQINITTLSPLRYQGWRISAQFSSGTTAKGTLSWYHKFKDTMGLSVSASYFYQKGFFTNEYNGKKADGQKFFNARLKYEWRLSNDLMLRNAISVSHLNQGGYAYENIESGVISYNDTCFYKRLLITDGLTLQWKPEPFIMSSITSVQYIDDNMTLDQDFLPKDYFTLTQKKKDLAFTQDFVFRNRNNESRYSWLAGLYGFYKNLDMDAPVTFKDYGISQLIEYHRNTANPNHPISWDSRSFPLNSEFKIPTYGLALYHESKYSLERWDFTVGLRVDYEHATLKYRSHCNTGYMIYNLQPDGTKLPERHAELIIDDKGRLSKHFFNFMPKIAVLYKLNDQVLNIFLNISRGYKTGGYNTQMFSDVLKQRLMGVMGVGANMDIDKVVGYEPEESWNYEIGTHLSLLESRLHADISLFYIDCRNQQLTVFPPGTTTGRMMTNAGRTNSFGTEITATYKLLDNLMFTASYGYTNAKFRRFKDGENNYKGKYIPYAPQNTLFVQGVYTLTLKNKYLSSITFDANMRGVGKIYWNETNTRSQSFYVLPGVSVSLENKYVCLQLWGRNISSTKYYTFYFVSIENEFRQKGHPAEFGATLRINI